MANRHLTPPLLPLSPPLTPYIPSSPANRVPLPSDSSDGLALEVKLLEHQITAADSLARNDSDSEDPMLLDLTKPPQSSPIVEGAASIKKRRANDLKVEGPLTPPMFSSSPMKKLKSVSFAEIIHQYIPNRSVTHEDLCDYDENTAIDFDDYDDFLRDLEPLAAEARKRVENEKLSGADTTSRVDVPDIDFSQPIAPWAEYSLSNDGKQKEDKTELEAQSSFLLRIKREDLKTASSCHGLSALERTLRWSIFTMKVSSIKIDEKIHGETELNKMLNEVQEKNALDTSSLLWKREGLSILDIGEEEEEGETIETEEFGEKTDMDSLIRKRKLELADEAAEVQRKRMVSHPQWRASERVVNDSLKSHHQKQRSSVEDISAKHRGLTTNHKQHEVRIAVAPRKHEPTPDSGNELMFGGFSASTALHRFMETRGREKSLDKVSRSTMLPLRPSSTSACVPLSTHPGQPSAKQPTPSKETALMYPAASVQDKRVQLPDLPQTLAPSTIIASLALLQRRSLMKQVEQSYPNAEILYRDYTLPHSPSQEADFVLSPSTGLVLITLQQVKQRALPGQPDRSPVKERLSALQARYERLVVIISDGFSCDIETRVSTCPDDPRDKEALTRFGTFAHKLDAEVLTRYIRGGEQAMARAMVIAMAEFGLPHGSKDIGDIKPLAEETSVSRNGFAGIII